MKTLIIPTVFVIGLILLGAGSMSAQASSVAGDWDAAYNTPGGPRAVKLILKVDGEKITGTAKRPTGDLPVTGTLKGSDITFEYTVNYNGNDLTLSFSGKVSGDSMSGYVSFGGNASDEWSAKRAPAEKPKTN